MKSRLCVLGLATVLGIGLAAAARQDAQAPAPPAEGVPAAHRGGMDPNRQVRMLTKRLHLTGDQQTQILPILTDRQHQVEGLRGDTSVAPKDKRDKMRSIREDSDGKIKAVLTDSQKKTYEEMQQQMRELMEQRRQAVGGGQPGSDL